MTFPLQIAGRTLWQEARGETLDGQQAVAHVLWNRVRLGKWGHTLASVCLWKMQFDGWRSVDPNFQPSCALADDDPELVKLMDIVAAAETASDITNDATHYYAANMRPPPLWAKLATLCGRYGNQIFFKNVP